MAVLITRTPWVDDDGSGTTGTVINNAVKTELYNQIDAGFAQLTPVQTPAAGTPIDHPYAAGDYTGAAPLTWTVSAANVKTNSYSIVGKLVTWVVVITDTTLGGSQAYQINLRLPGGLTTSKDVRGGIGHCQSAATPLPAQFSIATNTVAILRNDVQLWPLGTLHLMTTFHFWMP